MPLSLLALLLLQEAAPRETAPSPARPPNILIALADDLDPDHPGFCGNPLARTPALDQLARDGAYFPVLYVQPVCRAAHATLLTGRWPHETGIVNNRVARKLDPAAILPTRLREKGYASFCAGKLWEGIPSAYGFDGPDTEDRDFARAPKAGQPEVFRFLEEHAGKQPWFLWWAPNLPHLPHRPPARLAKVFSEVPIPLPPGFGGDPAVYVQEERDCLAMETWFDERLGELLAKVAELGELDDTVIVFLSDNGWSTAEPAKGTPREKGIRSPLVVSVPGKPMAGTRRDELVSLTDLHATVLDYAGLEPDPADHGRSLRPLLEGRPYEPRERLFGTVFTRTQRGGDEGRLAALFARDERWKYVLYVCDVDSEELSADAHLAPTFRRRAGTEELFDLEADPLERVDLSAREELAERRKTLREAALAWWTESGGTPLELSADGAH